MIKTLQNTRDICDKYVRHSKRAQKNKKKERYFSGNEKWQKKSGTYGSSMKLFVLIGFMRGTLPDCTNTSTLIPSGLKQYYTLSKNENVQKG